MDTKSFSITIALRTAWHIYQRKPLFFIALSFGMIVLHLSSLQGTPYEGLFTILTAFIGIVYSYMVTATFIAIIDKKEVSYNVDSLRAHIPSARDVLMLFLISVIVGVCVALGVVVLIIPGIYLLIRLFFAQIAYIDRKGKVLDAIKYSWHIVNKDAFWQTAKTTAVALVLLICGASFFGIGLVVTYPLSMLLLIQLYRHLSTPMSQEQLVVDQTSESVE